MERLSPHYRLDCDYRTAVMTCWEDGGNEPLYLCESHAHELGAAAKGSEAIRAVTDESARSNGNPAPVIASEPRPVRKPIQMEVQKQQVDERPTPIVDPPSKNPTAAAHQAPACPPAPVKALPAKAQSSVSPETTGSFPNAKVARALKDAPARSPARDLTYGNPAKAMVDEAIWNLAAGDFEAYRAALRQGKSVMEAAQAAGGQLAVAHRKIVEYKLKLEVILSESGATISVREAIDRPLEDAMLEVIANQGLGDTEKDASIQQLGALEEWIKSGLRRDMTLLEANRLLRQIGDRLNWGSSSDVSDKLKPAYGALFSSLKNSLRAAEPDAQNLIDRFTNLNAAKSDLEASPTKESSRELNTATV